MDAYERRVKQRRGRVLETVKREVFFSLSYRDAVNFLECGEYYTRIGFEKCTSRASLTRAVNRLSACEDIFRELNLRLLPALGGELCGDSSGLKVERYRYEGDQTTWRKLREKGGGKKKKEKGERGEREAV